MKGLDLSKFKKMASDGKSTTLKNAEGHKIIIAHHALSPAMKKQLESISKKYADGGDVEEDDRSPASMFNPEEARAASAKKFGMSQKVLDDMDAIKEKEGPVQGDNLMGPAQPEPTMMDRVANVLTPGAERAEQEAIAQQQWEKGIAADKAKMSAAQPPVIQGPAPASAGAQSIAPQQAAPSATSGTDLTGVMNQYASGASQEARAVGAQGRAEAEVQNQQIQAQQLLMNSFQQQSQHAMQEIHAVMEDYRNQHINPNHYMESMSAGQKVQTAIGMILGGMGAGLTGGENVAAKFLDNQIQRDISAQEKNMGNKQTLLGFNFQKYGNMRDAVTMTDAMMKGIYATKLEKAASISKDPIAKARALQAAAKFKAEIIPNIQKFSQSQALQGLINSEAKTEDAYKAKMNALAAVSPEHYKEMKNGYIPGVGTANAPVAEKDREALSSAKPVIDALTELQALAATYGTTVPGSQQDEINKTKVAALQLDLKGPAAYNLGQISGTDKDMLDSVVSNPGSLRTASTIAKLEATKKNIMGKYKATLNKIGITPFQGGASSGLEGKTASDAKGNKIIMKNGKWVPYGS